MDTVRRDVVDRVILGRNIGNARSLLLVLKAYESDFGRFPVVNLNPGTEAFESLIESLESEGFLEWHDALNWEDPVTSERLPWVFVPTDATESSFSRRPVFLSPRPDRNGRFVIAYVSGHVVAERSEAATWQAVLEEIRISPSLPRPDPASGDP